MRNLLILLLLASPALAVRGPSDSLQGVQIFPSNSIWNTPVDTLPLSSSSTLWTGVAAHGGHNFQPEFGYSYAGALNGMPYNIVCGPDITPRPISWNPSYDYRDESNVMSTIPMPADAFIEGDSMTGNPPIQDPNGDSHMILIDTCTHFEYDVARSSRVLSGGAWTGSMYTNVISTWDYTSNAMRPRDWTSTDAAGFPLLPLLIRWDEIVAGEITHAIRFTLELTHGPYVWPARHNANSGGTTNPPFGTRWRLKASYNISGFSATNQIILKAMKKYGMILADNGGDWFFGGAPNPNWDSNDLANLRVLTATNDMEVVDQSSLMVDFDSMQAGPSAPVVTGPRALRGNVPMRGRGALK